MVFIPEVWVNPELRKFGLELEIDPIQTLMMRRRRAEVGALDARQVGNMRLRLAAFIALPPATSGDGPVAVLIYSEEAFEGRVDVCGVCPDFAKQHPTSLVLLT